MFIFLKLFGGSYTGGLLATIWFAVPVASVALMIAMVSDLKSLVGALGSAILALMVLWGAPFFAAAGCKMLRIPALALLSLLGLAGLALGYHLHVSHDYGLTGAEKSRCQSKATYDETRQYDQLRIDEMKGSRIHGFEHKTYEVQIPAMSGKDANTLVVGLCLVEAAEKKVHADQARAMRVLLFSGMGLSLLIAGIGARFDRHWDHHQGVCRVTAFASVLKGKMGGLRDSPEKCEICGSRLDARRPWIVRKLGRKLCHDCRPHRG